MRRLLLLLILICARVASADLIENVAARADATQTYTLYLPSTYDAAKKYPLLLVFDPRGRGTKAAEIFRNAAEEYGWILISSNQTRSDESNEPNERALRALMPEVSRYASDPKRIYATGFSGTAILAWGVGILTGKFAGVIGVGGRYVESVPPSRFSFAHYGFAGERDFNNREMRLVEEMLDRENKVPHRFTAFDGEHRWITPELAREALGWFEVLAGNEKVKASVLAADIAAADKLRGLAALRRYRAIARTYGDESVRAKIAQLESDPAVKREREDEAKWDEYEQQYISGVFARIPSLFASLRALETPPNGSDAARKFRIAELRRHASRDGAEAATARRLLEAVYTQASFYLMRQLFDRKEYALAAALLAMASEIHPDHWDVWYNLGAAQARAGNRRHAFDALDKAIAAGFKDASQLQADEDFASLRDDKRFQETVRRLQ